MFSEQTSERSEIASEKRGYRRQQQNPNRLPVNRPLAIWRRANSGLLTRWRQGRSTSLNPLNANEYGKNPHRVLTQIATVMRLVHRLGETGALELDPLALGPRPLSRAKRP